MQGGWLHRSHSILMVFNPILCYLSPKILTFQEPLIVETQNKCHWIWYALNPKYMPLKPFWCIFPSQNQQNVKFLAVCWTPSWQKIKKCQFEWGNNVWKGLIICTYRFLGMLIAMYYVRTLCDKYMLSYDGFSWFLTGRFRHRFLKHGAGVEWDARGLLYRSHSILMVFNPILCYLSPKILICQELLIIEIWNKCH